LVIRLIIARGNPQTAEIFVLPIFPTWMVVGELDGYAITFLAPIFPTVFFLALILSSRFGFVLGNTRWRIQRMAC
jgi:hypothetical protein